jgi:hypothetical protein
VLVAGEDEPIRRYFTHAIAAGSELGSDPVRLAMRGSIRLGVWVPFRAEQVGDARRFAWHARVGRGLLHVVDRYAEGAASMDGRLLGRVRLFHDAGADVLRSGATRTALEATYWPPNVLPQHGISWRAEADDHLVATWDVPPERPEVHVLIGADGVLRATWAQRWRPGGRRAGAAYVACGADVHAERRFGGVAVPASFTVSWWFGTPRQAPFFRAEIVAVAPVA